MMFAGLPELFVILIVVFAAWHVVKAFNRMQRSVPPSPGPRPRAQGSSAGRPLIEAEDLVSCRVCGTYIAATARHCGRAQCPQPR
jgi:hypothetical protein